MTSTSTFVRSATRFNSSGTLLLSMINLGPRAHVLLKLGDLLLPNGDAANGELAHRPLLHVSACPDWAMAFVQYFRRH
jgi:hypothetical protein